MNAIICVWHSTTLCRISLKAHCVSTEFTAKKHGGEKGVPFRLQVSLMVIALSFVKIAFLRIHLTAIALRDK